MQQILWIDTETTGVEPKRNAVVRLGYILEEDRKVVLEGDLCLRPFPQDVIDPQALLVNKLSREEIYNYPAAKLEMSLFTSRLRAAQRGKFVLAGYNVRFDSDFLFQLFKKCGFYYNDFFHWPVIDVATCVAEVFSYGVFCHNAKLGTVCEYFGVPLGEAAHGALADIQATRKLYYTLKEERYATGLSAHE